MKQISIADKTSFFPQKRICYQKQLLSHERNWMAYKSLFSQKRICCYINIYAEKKTYINININININISVDDNIFIFIYWFIHIYIYIYIYIYLWEVFFWFVFSEHSNEQTIFSNGIICTQWTCPIKIFFDHMKNLIIYDMVISSFLTMTKGSQKYM